jgi:hypothetical protein
MAAEPAVPSPERRVALADDEVGLDGPDEHAAIMSAAVAATNCLNFIMFPFVVYFVGFEVETVSPRHEHHRSSG